MQTADIKKISFKEAHDMLSYDKNSILLDVREENEYIQGHPEEAVLFPVDSINEKSAKEIIDNFNSNLIVYCKSGKRSSLASKRLAELGYKNIFDMQSLIGWPYGFDY